MKDESRSAAPVSRVQDTARWVAMIRALESERPDKVFDDPLARMLAGPRGEEVQAMIGKRLDGWPAVARTWLLDRLILETVGAGVDAVVNLAAGFDTRPYRLSLPPALHWIEVDHDDVVREKNEKLEGRVPRCQLERVALDLADLPKRRALLRRIGREHRRVLVVTEGLLLYLPPEAAHGLARDIADCLSCRRWLLDLVNPGVLDLLRKGTRGIFTETAFMRFGPAEGPRVFEPEGWRAVESHSLIKTAASLKRLGFFMRLAAMLPEDSFDIHPRRPWGGVCVLEKGLSSA